MPHLLQNARQITSPQLVEQTISQSNLFSHFMHLYIDFHNKDFISSSKLIIFKA